MPTPRCHLTNLFEPLVHSTSDKIQTAIAGAAITSPLWLAYLKAASEIAGMLMPICGLVLVGVNLVASILKHMRELRSP